eukprot:3514702-Pleurochrysis_carterae.AAC.1
MQSASVSPHSIDLATAMRNFTVEIDLLLTILPNRSTARDAPLAEEIKLAISLQAADGRLTTARSRRALAWAARAL